MRQFIICIFIVCSLSISYAQDRQVIDKVVGVVGQELVLLSDIEDQFSLAKKRQPELGEEARCLIMDQVLAQNLMLNQARLDSIVVTENEIESQLDARIKQILQYMGNDEKQFEEYYGATISQVRSQFRTDLENKLLIERMQQDIIADATVTPSEVRDFFNLIPRDSLPFFNSEVEVAEIVIYPSQNMVEKTKAREKLESIRQQIIDGAQFAELAVKYSDDPGSGAKGGDLGWATRGSYVGEFEAAAYNLETNELSEIVETQFGYHLLELLERRGNSIHVRHILITPEITPEDEILARARLDSVRNLVLVDSIPFFYAVNRFSDEDIPSYTNGGNLVNPKTGNTFYEVGDLDPDIYFTIDTMEVNDLSAPFEFTEQTGRKGYRAIQLRSRTKPHKASLSLDYSKIKAAALESKKNKFMFEWVEKKIKDTYIELDAQYSGCEDLERWKTGY